MSYRFPPLTRHLFHGYWIVLVAFLCLFFTMGCGVFAFSLFTRPLEDAMGWSRGQIMVGFTIFFVTMGLASPVVGRLVDRHGARKVIVAGALLFGTGFVLLSRLQALWMLYIAYGVIGTGGAFMGAVPSSTIVSNWFVRHRGAAVGVMSSGIGVGGLVIAPLVGNYIMPSFGWRVSYLALALLTWVVMIPLTLIIVRTRPEEMGLHPDGAGAPISSPGTEHTEREASQVSFRTAIASIAFWLIATSYFLSTFSQMGMLQSQVPYLEDIGFPLGLAASALGGVGLGSGVGKLIFGWLCDRIKAKYACTIGLVLQLTAVLLLLSITPDSHVAMLWVYALTHGLGAGSWLPTMSMIVSTSFGLASYGVIFGAASFVQCVGTATGPLMAGLVYDVTGSYMPAFIAFASLYAISIPAILVVRERRRHRYQ
ncbi:MAG: MFS transporter [Chloroflexota bacterium]